MQTAESGQRYHEQTNAKIEDIAMNRKLGERFVLM